MENPSQPLVSIITFVKNRRATMARCMRSVLEQDYKNIEYIIQDGASTDGTLDVIRSFDDPRIKLQSEPDSAPTEAWFKSLKRCTGAYIGLVMSDETYLDGAVRWAVEAFQHNPTAGAVYGDGYTVRLDGSIIEPVIAPKVFSFEGYLRNECLPHPGNTFFRRQALLDVGLLTHDWVWDAGEYEVYLRLGHRFPIAYHPGKVSNFAVHDQGQLGKNREIIERVTNGEVKIFQRFFSDPALSPELKRVEPHAYAGIFCRSAHMLASTGQFYPALATLARCEGLDCGLEKPATVLNIIKEYMEAGRHRRTNKPERKSFGQKLFSCIKRFLRDLRAIIRPSGASS